MATDCPVALVTGAGSGIGRAVALALAAEGWAVVLAGRRAMPLDETASLAPGGVRMLPVPTDIADPAAVDALFERIGSAFGRLDLLFNNAGLAIGGAADALDPADWSLVVAVNLTGAFLCARAAFRLMKLQRPRGGRIINNGSIAAHAPRPNSVAYTATKHAITGLTKSLSLDGRDFDIACGQIDIGNADTAITAAMKQGVPQANGTIAVEPTIEIAHVARTVLLMAQMPLDANVQFVTVMATRMPFIGRG